MYGQLINNEYLVINMVGCGVYSKVWLAYKISTKTFVAIKMINEEDEHIGNREIDVNKKFKSSSKLNLLIDDFIIDYENEEYYCMVFPLLAGTLYDLRKDVIFSEEDLEKIYKKASELLTELHTKYELIHGDIKPENFGFKGINPISQSIIEKFNNLGGLDAYLKDNTDLDISCGKLIDDLLSDDDLNSDLFSVYNSSNEDEDSDDLESDDEDSDNLESNDEEDSDGESCEENSNKEKDSTDSVGYEASNDAGSSTDIASEVSEITIENLPKYTVDQEFLNNLEISLIDYSHVHNLEEDLDYEPTRYYRCPQTLKKEKAGYYKDWFALACTMYELETGKVFVDPQSDDKDKEQLEFIKKNQHLIEKWLKKN